MAKRLTQIAVDKMKPHETQRLEISDAGKPGLYLVIQPKPSGKKSWAVRYRHRGQPRKLTLDGFPSLREAHRLAQVELDKIADGRDPAAEKKEAKRARAHAAEATDDLFPNVALRFIQRYAKPKNRSWAETARLLGLRQDKESGELVTVRGRLADKWSKRRIQEIRKRDVLDLLNDIVDRPAPVLANRTLAALRKLFNWCKSQDILAHEYVSPCAFVEPPTSVKPRDRVLSDDEIKLFWQACGKIGYPFGNIGKLLLLTGQRESEVAGMTRGEMKGSEWTVPRERAKNNHEHVVLLSEAALQIIERLPHISGTKRFLFTTTGNTPVSGFSRAKKRIDKLMGPIPPWRFHDIRRTVATGFQRLRVPQEVTDAALNHKSGKISGISAVYQKHHYSDEKRSAWDAWANFVLDLVGEQPALNVVPLRERA